MDVPQERYGSFLSSAALAWSDDHVATNKQLRGALESALRAADDSMRSVTVPQSDGDDLALVALWLRLVELTQSVTLLAERGCSLAAQVAYRAEMEVLFTLGACIHDAETLRSWAGQGYSDRIRWLNQLKNSAHLGSRPDVMETDSEFRATLEQQAESLTRGSLRVEELARIAGLHDLWVLQYWQLSGAAHSCSRDVEKNIVTDDAGRVIDFVTGPQPCDVMAAMAGILLLEGTDRLCDRLGASVSATFEQARDELTTLLDYYLESESPEPASPGSS